MRRSWLTLAVLTVTVSAAGPAAAEPPADLGDPQGRAFEPPPAIGKGKSFSERLADQLTLLGDNVNGHVGALTLDTVRFRIDGRARRAHLRVAGETSFLSLKVEGDVLFRGGAAQVDAAVDLSVAGHAISFELPDFEVMPRSYLGERYVEVRIPLIRGAF